MKRIIKSKMCVVLLEMGGQYGYYLLQRRTEEGKEPFLYVDSSLLEIASSQRDEVIKLLSKMGSIVRFYDPEEKNWMELREETGPIVVSGNRDGSWHLPETLEEFEQEYLGVR